MAWPTERRPCLEFCAAIDSNGHGMLRNLFNSFLDEAFEARSVPQLGRAFFGLAERFGYAMTVILDGRELPGPLRLALLFTTDLKTTMVAFDRRHPMTSHPTYLRAVREGAPFNLEDVRQAEGVAPKQWAQTLPPILREGMPLALPVHRAGRLVLLVCLNGARPEDTPLNRAILLTAAHVVFDRLQHLRTRGASSEDLTNREAECIRWIGLGKTDREIARIVGISERTVRYHARNAKAKLGASTRVEAIAKLAGAHRTKKS